MSLAISDGKHLYERATKQQQPCFPLWHMNDRLAFFAGPLGHNASHKHSVSVYVIGIEGSFALRIGDSDWQTCRTAVIPAGTAYEFDVGGNPIAVMYVEPATIHVNAMTKLVRNTREVGGALVGTGGELSLVRELWEDHSSADWAEFALDDLVQFTGRRAPETMDHRVARIVEKMYRNYADLWSVEQVAQTAELSASRFQHLFTQSVGVPFRRFRAWCRMRVAIGKILEGSNFTSAAHAAGFADQPHFAHDFRRTFGAPASRGLLEVRQRSRP